MAVLNLNGNWDEGYALDIHVVSSTYLGEDEYGNLVFDTTRSELGQCLYELKYQQKKQKSAKLGEIIRPLLKEIDLENKIDYIIPVPSSTPRFFQPVDVICEKVSEIINKNVCYEFLKKNSSNQSKNLTLEEKKKLVGTIESKKKFNVKANVLLIDDLYQSGQTLTECVNVLRNDGNIKKIYVLCMTKTKSKGG